MVDSKLILLSYCHVDILSTVGRQCRQLIDSVDSVDSQGSVPPGAEHDGKSYSQTQRNLNLDYPNKP